MEFTKQMEIYLDIFSYAKSRYEGFSVQFKDESRFMEILGKLLFFNRGFMTRYTTTIGNVVYFPSRRYVIDDYQRAWEILCHEIVHVEQYQRLKWAMAPLYLFPQILAPLVLLIALFSGTWLVYALALFFLLPLPAPYRAILEAQGYRMSLAVKSRAYAISDEYRKHVVRNFTGPAYYFMWPFRRHVEKLLEHDFKNPVFSDVFCILAKHGAIREGSNAQYN